MPWSTPVMGIKAFLQLGETLDVLRQGRAAFVLVQIEAAGVGGIECRELKSVGIIDAISLNQFRGFHGVNPLLKSAGRVPGGALRAAAPATTRSARGRTLML